MSRPQITVQRPCAESWEAMTPSAGGRHCENCQKTVLDFTAMSDHEILARLATVQSANFCGRFQAQQLDRPLGPPLVAPSRRWRVWLASMLTTWGLREAIAVKSAAQAPVEQRARKGSKSGTLLPIADTATVVIYGTVLDSASHESVIGAGVSLQGNDVGVATDVEGHFRLSVSISDARKHGIIKIIAFGFTSQEIVLPSLDSTYNMGQVFLRENSPNVSDDIIVGQSILRKPRPGYPRRFHR